MNDADFLAAVLSDGKPHTTNEILQASFKERGCGMTVHSRASDLRSKRGLNIACRSVGKVGGRNVFEYQLLKFSPRETGAAGDPPPVAPEISHASEGVGKEAVTSSAKSDGAEVSAPKRSVAESRLSTSSPHLERDLVRASEDLSKLEVETGLDSPKEGGSASPCISEGDPSGRHPAFAKQLSVFEASA